jgi:hypothetical protein
MGVGHIRVAMIVVIGLYSFPMRALVWICVSWAHRFLAGWLRRGLALGVLLALHELTKTRDVVSRHAECRKSDLVDSLARSARFLSTPKSGATTALLISERVSFAPYAAGFGPIASPLLLQLVIFRFWKTFKVGYGWFFLG